MSAEKMTNKRVLLMDDDPMVLDIAIRMLDHLGFYSSTAKNGEEAIKLYKQEFEKGQPFNIVILDLTIKSGMGGEETVKKILEINPSVIALVSSGNTNGLTLSNLKQIGFKGIIEKPYNVEEVKEKLNYIIEN